MKLCKVTGNIVSTVKTNSHFHLKLMIVHPVDRKGQMIGESFIAVDNAQSGIGEFVLVMEEGSSARQLLGDSESAVDAIIIGVIDQIV